MIRLTLSQMRKSVGRLVAAGVAIMIGTAFVAATLVAGETITRTSTDAIAAVYAKSDLVVVGLGLGPGDRLTPDEVAKVAAVDGVKATAVHAQLDVQLETDKRNIWARVVPTASDPRLDAQVVLRGALPTSPGQVALPVDMANRLGATVGGTVTTPAIATDGSDTAGAETLTVVGILDDPNGAFAMEGGAVMASQADVDRWLVSYNGGEQAPANAVGLTLADDADRAEVAKTIESTLSTEGRQVVARTLQEQAGEIARQLTGDAHTVTYVVLAFAALALIVAGLVIANTFQVLVAQRTRTLALLRCVGANKRQLRTSVLLEATILGLLASLSGIALGLGAAQVTLSVLSTRDVGVPLPTVVPVSVAVFAVPLLAGLLVTVLAATSPARAATRVAPLAALRPADAPSVRRGSTGRLVTAILMTVIGFVMLGLGAAAGLMREPMIGLLVGIPGGALSFVGVAVGSVFWIPKVTAWVGSLAARTGPSARLATANTLRNPRRTAATSTALLIGVTLVVMMTTGAESARQTFNASLDERYSVDVAILGGHQLSADGKNKTQLDAGVTSQIAAVDGVTATATITRGLVEAKGDDVPLDVAMDDGEGRQVMDAIDPATAATVMRDTTDLAPFTDDALVISKNWASYSNVTDGQKVTLVGAGGATADLTIQVVPSMPAGLEIAVTTATLLKLDPGAVTNSLLVRVADPENPRSTVADIQDVVDDLGVWTTGPVVERAMFDQVIDALLAVVVGLLAVAVFIALIGVTNTLSLSVLERQRENAMLRAIGLTRKQLRLTLAVEGLLIALVGTGLGVVLGTVYGWAGSAAALGTFGDIALAVPWRDLGLVLVVAVLAGLVASVLPARRATRTSPVEALAVD